MALCRRSPVSVPPAIASAWHSLRYFAGYREHVLVRDGYCCQGCGASRQRVVHHRRPGRHADRWLITVCPACHALIHKLLGHRHWLPAPLLELWREQHPAVPLQLQFDLERTMARQLAAA